MHAKPLNKLIFSILVVVLAGAACTLGFDEGEPSNVGEGGDAGQDDAMGAEEDALQDTSDTNTAEVGEELEDVGLDLSDDAEVDDVEDALQDTSDPEDAQVDAREDVPPMPCAGEVIAARWEGPWMGNVSAQLANEMLDRPISGRTSFEIRCDNGVWRTSGTMTDEQNIINGEINGTFDPTEGVLAGTMEVSVFFISAFSATGTFTGYLTGQTFGGGWTMAGVGIQLIGNGTFAADPQ